MDVEAVLQKMESMGLIRLHKPSGDYYQVYCPIHNNGQESKPSCGVLLHEQYKDGKRTPEGLFHCFRGDTEVITKDGLKQISTLCDKPDVSIINGEGQWEHTVFHNYGTDQLWKLTLSRDQQIKVIYTTKAHEWFVSKKADVYTTDKLKSGWYLQSLNISELVCPEYGRWRVESVEPTAIYEDVYCCETSTHSFVLGGNILTHNCFSCGWARSMPDTITEILKHKGVGISGLEWLKENIPGFDGSTTSDFDYLIPQNITASLQNKYVLDYINTQLNKPTTTYVSEQELASYRLTVPYMYQRGLTDEIIAKYDIGYDANFIPKGRKKPLPCVTFPVKDENGGTLFLCRRSIQGKFFHYPKGVEKSVYGIYELPKNTKSVLVCESCFNALTAIKYGYNAVALLGTGTTYEIEQLKRLGVQEYVLCLDGDEAGQRGAQKLKKALSSVALVWTIQMPVDKDVNDCTKEEFEQFYASRE